MPHRRKPFIDKKHATTFRLIPGFVPDPVEERNVLKTDEEVEMQKEEQRKYGIFYDDNYDYRQHLRSLTEGATMVKVEDFNNADDEVKSSYGGSTYGGSMYDGSMYGGSTYGSAYGGSINFRMFSTEVKTKEEHIDPDILASLDEAPVVKMTEDGEMEIDEDANFLDDDFITQAGGCVPKTIEEEEEYGSDPQILEDQDLGSDFDGYSDREHDDDDDDDDFYDAHSDMGGHQPGGRGTVQDDIIEAQTALILKNFEEGLGFSCTAQTDDDDGRATAEDYENLKEILMQDKLKKDKIMSCAEFLDDHASRPAFDYSKYSCDREEEEEFEWKEVPPSKPQFDCVSILSLNSTTRNLPTDIIPPVSEKKRLKNASTSETDSSALPGLTRRELEEEMRLSRRADKASTFRPEAESTEERKSRKKAIKEERKDRRQEKKANKMVFSMEKQKLDREVATLSKSGKGIKLS